RITTKSVKGAMFYEYPTIHHQHSPGYPGRLARTLSPHALARRSGGSRLGLWHERRVSEGAGGLLAAHVRLASTGGEAQAVIRPCARDETSDIFHPEPAYQEPPVIAMLAALTQLLAKKRSSIVRA